MTQKTDFEELALPYHESSPRGKIGIHITKPLDSQDELAMAYSPGVAGPCRKIAADEVESFRYTGRGNLVGVISNGSAVLGLGNIGAAASKPVMEGKAMLFKKFANIDVFDIEVNADDPDTFVQVVKSLEPTFGGINLEDIKAPECFQIERALREVMKIPVFHDDQHGTAIIAAAAFLNALELTQRKIEETKVVFSGAGAAAISCAHLFLKLGIQSGNLMMVDSKGVITTDRSDLNEFKKPFAVKSKCRTLADALQEADAFCGVSTAGVLKGDMIKKMARDPIIFALANPDPEINPIEAREIRPDAIIATGRSDFPNQVNNVLGFPYIFRGALDVQATTINEEMKLAAVKAIAGLARESVPEEVMAVYKDSESYEFGKDYLIPKPVDQRVLLRVAPAVAEAAMATGVARKKVDIAEYREEIEKILGPTRKIMRTIRHSLLTHTKPNKRPKVVFTNGSDGRVIKAVKEITDAGELEFVLLGSEDEVMSRAKKFGIKNLSGVEFRNPSSCERAETYAEKLYAKRQRRGLSLSRAHQWIRQHDYYAAMMLELGEVDLMITGAATSYKEAVTPVLQVIGPKPGHVLAGVYMLMIDHRLFFFADCTINISPDASTLADIAIATAELAKHYIDDPIRIAMLSYASFGTSNHPTSKKMAQAVEIVRERQPNLEIDGEMQADVAFSRLIRRKDFPFCRLSGDANVLVFPDLASANIAYKLLINLASAIPTGPILVGVNKPVHVMQRSATTKEIVNLTYIGAKQVLGS